MIVHHHFGTFSFLFVFRFGGLGHAFFCDGRGLIKTVEYSSYGGIKPLDYVISSLELDIW